MNKDLIKRNQQIRANRPLISSDVLYSTYENNGVFQICFKSRGCTNYLRGFCIMCDYGVGINITPEELGVAFDSALKESKEKVRVLLLNAFGSVLDFNEISEDCFRVLLAKLESTDIKNIIFETHYTTITKEKLDLIKATLSDKHVTFELGLETSNEQVRGQNLLKYINNVKFIETVKLVHSYGFSVIANIIVGIPFMSEEEQVNDALESIKWCFGNDIDEVDLFPMNIRPYTLLEELYEKGEYEIISHWMLIEVLSRVPTQYLSDIYIAWYGNRDLKYSDGMHSIFPTSCTECEDDLVLFYKSYLSNNDSSYRKKLIEDLIENKKCKCYRKIKKLY